MLKLENLVKVYSAGQARWRGKSTTGRAAVLALDGVSLEVQEGELFTLLGPSGCGKTTTLRSIAGLERPDSGSIRLKDTTFFDGARRVNVPANSRNLGMAFQSYAIWPHMTVFHNVAFPLEVMPRRTRPGRAEIKQRVMRILEVTELHNLADRPATKLSGGQQQRLALARAIVNEPELVLLDEPLSNLDAKLRESMRFELKRLQRELGLTAVYVTHDQSEALVLSSRIAVMKDGVIMQIDKPREIYTNPANEFVAEFVGVSNFIPGHVDAPNDEGLTKITTNEGVLWATRTANLPRGSKAVVSVRPENIEISTVERGGAVRNEWRGSVVTRAFLGDCVDHVVSVGKVEVRVRSNPSVSIRPGTEVFLCIEPPNVTVVPQLD